MNKLIGIDIGTSSVKTVLIDRQLNVLAMEKHAYGVSRPHPNWAEQDPEIWWKGVKECLANLDGRHEASVIGLSGQMHGLVAVDNKGMPVFSSIIWLDSRSEGQRQRMNFALQEGQSDFHEIAAGMLLPSLVWVKENQPDLYRQIHKVMLPKDYVRFKLTGEIGTDHSDASGTGAYHFKTRDWDFELLKELEIDCAIFPKIKNPTTIVGKILPSIAEQLSLSLDTKVVFGGSDHSMQLIGNSIFSPGILNCNIGTGSQISLTVENIKMSQQLSLFCHARNDLYNLVGASLNGGIVLQWLKGLSGGVLSFKEMETLAQSVPAGSGGIVFLPYLNGERNPFNEKNAKGICYGLTAHHRLGHLVRAAMEGMIFCLRDCLEVFKGLGVGYQQVIASGGGAKSKVLLQIMADIFDREIYVAKTDEQAAVGAAIIGGLGIGQFSSLDAVQELFAEKLVLAAKPEPHNVKKYAEIFQLFQQIRAQNMNLFKETVQ